MKKTSLAFFTLVLISISCRAQIINEVGYTWKDLELKGKVSYFEESSYYAKKAGTEIIAGNKFSPSTTNKINFNNSGYPLSVEYYNEKDEFKGKAIYHYENDTTKKVILHYLKTDSLYSIDSFFYDNSGKLLRIKTRNFDHNITIEMIYTYSDDNKTVRIDRMEENKFESRYIFKYGDKHKEIYRSSEDENGWVSWSNTSTYDSAGNETSHHNYLGDTLLKNTFISHTMKYSPENKLIWYQRSNSKGTIFQTTKYEYDENGMMTGWSGTNEDPNEKIEMSFKYQFDDHGNFISKTELSSDTKTPYKIIRRKINYFE